MRDCPIFVSFVGILIIYRKPLWVPPEDLCEEDRENSGYGTWLGAEMEKLVLHATCTVATPMEWKQQRRKEHKGCTFVDGDRG